MPIRPPLPRRIVKPIRSELSWPTTRTHTDSKSRLCSSNLPTFQTTSPFLITHPIIDHRFQLCIQIRTVKCHFLDQYQMIGSVFRRRAIPFHLIYIVSASSFQARCRTRRMADLPIASPGRTISITTPMVSPPRLGEWGVLAIPSTFNPDSSKI